MTATSRAQHPQYERLPLHLPLLFAREGSSESVECITESISGDEVYFVSPQVLKPGERVDVDLLLPTHKAGEDALKVHLKCFVDVQHSTRTTSGFRVVCRIRGYKVGFGNSDSRKD